MAWNIAKVLLPLIILAFLSHQAGEKIRCSNFSPVRALGLSLLGIGWLGCSLLAFIILIIFVAPMVAWPWITFVTS
jgi:hypothetical protein